MTRVFYLAPARKAPARQLICLVFLTGWLLFLADDFLIKFPFPTKGMRRNTFHRRIWAVLFHLRVQTSGLVHKSGEMRRRSPADLAFPGPCACAVWAGGFVQALPGLISRSQQGWGWRRLGVLMESGMILSPSAGISARQHHHAQAGAEPWGHSRTPQSSHGALPEPCQEQELHL